MAVAFAEMHDTPTRMVAKGVLQGIVPWACARPFLAIRLRRRSGVQGGEGGGGVQGAGKMGQQSRGFDRGCELCGALHLIISCAALGSGAHLQTAHSLGRSGRAGVIHSCVCVAARLCRNRVCAAWLTASLLGRLAEEEIVKHITTIDAKIHRADALDMFRTW